MTIAYFANFINHHQVHLSDELYRLTGGNYYFVETLCMPDWLRKSGYQDYTSRPYVIKAWEDKLQFDKAMALALESDVVLFGGVETLPFIKRRAKAKLFSIEITERRMKRGWINALSPTFLHMMLNYYRYFRKAPFYKLCSSAFGANDEYKLHAYRGKCYKWGYFTNVDKFDIDASLNDESRYPNSILWCARFLKLKHPELPVLLAHRLKENGYKFSIDMYGSGSLLEKTKRLADKLNVSDCVRFNGNVPNALIIDAMRKHTIFLFTSNQKEGWGAVSNEAMSNGCVLVGSNRIGSIPFLIKDGFNGMVFESENLDSLYDKVVFLLDHPKERADMAKNAYLEMCDLWSPANAANRLLQLINDLKNNRDTSFSDGPCSIASPIL